MKSLIEKTSDKLVRAFLKNKIIAPIPKKFTKKLRDAQKTVNKNFKPIIETLKEEDKKLNKAIKKVLQPKQYKKWIKYNKKLNKSFSE